MIVCRSFLKQERPFFLSRYNFRLSGKLYRYLFLKPSHSHYYNAKRAAIIKIAALVYDLQLTYCTDCATQNPRLLMKEMSNNLDHKESPSFYN